MEQLVKANVDYIRPGYIPDGDVADKLISANGDMAVLRPWMDAYGRTCVTRERDGKEYTQILATNTPSTLLKLQWQILDEVVIRVARAQLRVWGSLEAHGLTYSVPNGMAYSVLQHQVMSDAGEATLSMDGLRETHRARTIFDLVNMPLPIVHSDFQFSARELIMSRTRNHPLDLTMVEQATRRVAEVIEKLTLGTLASYSYGGGTVYGLTNFPNRVAVNITSPTDVGWNPQTTNDDVLGMIQQLRNIFFNGPYGIVYSLGRSKYLDSDYSAAYPGITLKDRILKNTDVSFMTKADYLPNYQLIVYQLTQDCVQAVTGMALNTVQWDSQGGLQKNFKIMGIMIPRIRSNINNTTGLCVGVGV